MPMSLTKPPLMLERGVITSQVLMWILLLIYASLLSKDFVTSRKQGKANFIGGCIDD